MRASLVLATHALGALVAEAYAVPFSSGSNGSLSSRPPRQRKRTIGKRDDDPSDFSWVKRWAAVGDSYTAGIGAGSLLGTSYWDDPDKTNWYCSRYDGAWPILVNDALGGSVENFYYPACSGDRTGGIYQQIQDLEGDMDLVMLTAGGNDLCLAKMLEKCVLLPAGDTSCEDVMTIAQDNIESILKDNIQQLITALDDKMNDDGVVIYNGYAQFFNTETEDCANQPWSYATLWPGNSGLTIERRETFNNMVVQINAIIKDIIDSSTGYRWKIGFSNWDPWVSDGVNGQMCDPDGSGDYPDPDQPDLQFFKPDTSYSDSDGELKRRMEEYAPLVEKRRAALAEIEHQNFQTELYNSILFNSANPGAEVKHKLDRRNPSPPNCPGDTDDEIQPASIGLPDWVGKMFHPNELGHYTIASFALQTLVDTRAAVLDVEAPSCEVQDDFTCWQGEGNKAYSSADLLNEDYKTFCKGVAKPSGESGWSSIKTFHKGTPDETQFLISLDGTSTSFSESDCEKYMSTIINSCDGNDPDNPMDWKFGGQYKHGDWTYQVNPMNDNRHWPVPTSAGGVCHGWYHGIWSTYEIKGYGWLDSDWGQDSLLPHAKSCVGGGITDWQFTYFDTPDEDGYEWHAHFRTPLWVRSRCFKNNKVQIAAGGFTNGCGGND